MEEVVEGWVDRLLQLDELHERLREMDLHEKPLRCVWVSQDSPEWTIEGDSLQFVPVVCLSASRRVQDEGLEARHGWTYVQGAADDASGWARGLTPELFWQNVEELTSTRMSITDVEVAVDELVAEAATPAQPTSNSPTLVRCATLEHPLRSICLATLPLQLDLGAVPESAWLNLLSRQGCTSAVISSSVPVEPPSASFKSPHLLGVLFVADSGKHKHCLETALADLVPWSKQHTGSLLVLTHGPDADKTAAMLASTLLASFLAAPLSKSTLRDQLTVVQSSWPGVYPSRRLQKQANRYFLSAAHTASRSSTVPS